MQAVSPPSYCQEAGVGPQLSFTPPPRLPPCCVSLGKSHCLLSLNVLVWKRGVITYFAGFFKNSVRQFLKACSSFHSANRIAGVS